MTDDEFVAAWSEIYRKVIRYAIRLGVPGSDAADVVGDAVLRAWEKRAEIRNPSAFIIRTVRFFAMHHTDSMRAKYHAIPHNPADLRDLREAKRNDPYAVLDIQAALAALPARDRALIEESGEFGAITRQAKEAGVSIKKMQRRIYEIRETIRAALT